MMFTFSAVLGVSRAWQRENSLPHDTTNRLRGDKRKGGMAMDVRVTDAMCCAEICMPPAGRSGWAEYWGLWDGRGGSVHQI